MYRRILQLDEMIEHFKSEDSRMFPSYIFRALELHTPWEQQSIFIHGKEIPQPRLVCLYGESSYSYSNMTLLPNKSTTLIRQLKKIVEETVGIEFNNVLMNYYRSGRDSIGFHSDDEPELGIDPIVASLSLGGTRTLILRHKFDKVPDGSVDLGHGDILLMNKGFQKLWRHGIMKSTIQNEPRISLTFRNIVGG